jgi:endonuclease YncB( thermonuclease family)
MQNEKLKQIRQTKELEYGSFDTNMKSIGRMWSSLLGLKEDIPGWLVANMYVAAKLIRTKTKFKKDTYDDAANYLHQAELMQEKDKGIYRDWIVGYNKWKKNGRNN